MSQRHCYFMSIMSYSHYLVRLYSHNMLLLSYKDRAIFNLVLKVIRDCIGFALLCSVSGLENSRHLLSQSDTKLKPIATWLLAFSRA